MALSAPNLAIWNAIKAALLAGEPDAAFATFVNGIGSNDSEAQAVVDAAKTATGATSAKAALGGLVPYLEEAVAQAGFANVETRFHGRPGSPLVGTEFADLLAAGKSAM